MAFLNFASKATEPINGTFAQWEKEGMEIIADNPRNLDYELSKKPIFYFQFVWVIALWAGFKIFLFSKILRKTKNELRHMLPRLNFLVDHSDLFKQIRKGAGSWRALNIVYNYHNVFRGQETGLKGVESKLWIGRSCNGEATRNRKQLTKAELKKAIRKFFNEPVVRILSIASGSAQALMESINELSQEIYFNYKVILLDSDKSAIEASRKMAIKYGIEKYFEFVNKDFLSLFRIAKGFRPHIVEMVGFLDYLPDDTAVSIIKHIRKSLSESGVFLTCNIRTNLEKPLVDYCLMWPMIYRSPRRLAELMIESGFKTNSIRIIYEPHGIHGLAICHE